MAGRRGPSRSPRRSTSGRAVRRFQLIAATCTVAVAVAAGLAVSQSGVTGAEKDRSRFTVAGDGSLTTKKPALGDSRDPLSTDETGYAIHLASTDRSIPAGATNVRGGRSPEFLYADLPDDDVDAGGRRVLVALYDYTDDKTYHQLVDLTAGRVTSSKSAARLQPPPSSDEADAAITTAINATKPPAFVAAFEQLEGVPLISPEQVTYAAGAWIFDGTTAGGAACGDRRCVRLMVSTPSGLYLDTSDVVVDLSKGALIRLEKS